MAKLKLGIGFHTGTPCACNGIGDYLERLADDGHVITVKCNDGTASLLDFQREIQNGAEGIGIYRTLKGYDVPPYGGDIPTVAEGYFDKIVNYFPPELDKRLFYVECMNEVDKNYSDWLGYLLCEIAKLMLDDDRRFCGPGWATGEPEPEHWGTPGMLAWLQMCADNKDELAISLHEYSLIDNLDSTIPYNMGRVSWMNSVCKANGIPFPDVFVSEFGWMYNDAPDKNEGVRQTIEMAKWYIKYAPNVKALHIWALDKSKHWPKIPDIINQYIEPLASAIIATDWQEPITPDVPTLPGDPMNLFTNPSFEVLDGKTYKHNGIDEINIPVGWEYWFATPDLPNPIDSSDGARWARPEVVNASRANIPDYEEDDFFFDGDRTLKSAKGHGSIWFKLFQTIIISSLSEYTITLNVFADLVKGYDGADKIWADDGRDGLVCLSVDGDRQPWQTLTPGSKHTIDWLADFDIGEYKIGFEFMCPFPLLNNGLFIDHLQLVENKQPSESPKPIKFVEYVYPQEIGELDYIKITAAAWKDYRRSLGGSVEHAIAAMTSTLASDESYVVVWNPDQPSQISAIEKLIKAKVAYQTRYLVSSPDRFPSNIKLGYLFKWRYVLTSPFNAPRNYANGLHEGVDYDIISGLSDNIVPVLCTYDGVVDNVGESSGYGLRVRVKHNLGEHIFYTWYCHLDEIYVEADDVLNMGDEVGEIGATGNSTGEHIHFNLEIPGYGLSNYAVADVVDPFPYLPDPSGLPIYASPQTTYDIAAYMYGDGRMYEVRHADGRTETFQVRQRGANRLDFDLVKNHQYESMSYDNQYIWRGIDTSPGCAPHYAEHPGKNRYYIQFEPGKTTARWALRNMTIGQTYTGLGHHVQFYYKDNCESSSANSGSATNQVTLVSHYDRMTWNEITVYDVIALQTNTGEKMFFARGYGLVAWSNSSGGQSAICEIHEGRDNLAKETGCFSH